MATCCSVNLKKLQKFTSTAVQSFVVFISCNSPGLMAIYALGVQVVNRAPCEANVCAALQSEALRSFLG
jgi:hypothetical protein